MTDDVRATTDDLAQTGEDSTDGDLVTIRLLRFPLRVYARATEHHHDLFREFALLAAATPTSTDTVPARLTALIEVLGRRYPPDAAQEQERKEALASGELERDFTIKVPRSAAAASAELGRLLDEADDFCRAGDLLTLATPPDARAFRRWYLAEVIAQAEGRAPTPWPGDLD